MQTKKNASETTTQFYLEPVNVLYFGASTLQNKVFSNQNKGPHLGSRYSKIWCFSFERLTIHSFKYHYCLRHGSRKPLNNYPVKTPPKTAGLVQIIEKDLWEKNISQFDVTYFFLYLGNLREALDKNPLGGPGFRYFLFSPRSWGK